MSDQWWFPILEMLFIPAFFAAIYLICAILTWMVFGGMRLIQCVRRYAPTLVRKVVRA